MAPHVGYTLVQHSGYGYGRKPGWDRGLEPRAITTADKRRVEKVGGMIFPDYAKADEAAFKLMYPDDGFYMYPRFKGTFANVVVDGLKVAIPLKVEVEA